MINNFTAITELLADENIPPFAVVVDGLHWIADLFTGRNHQLQYIEELEKWGRVALHSRHLSILCLPDLDIVSSYIGAKGEDENCIFVGGPTVDELERTMELNTFVDKMHEVFPAFPQLSKADRTALASVFKLKGFSLLNSIHSLHHFCRSLAADRKKYNGRQFVEAFKKDVGVAIEDVQWHDDVILDKKIKKSIEGVFRKFTERKVKEIPKGLLLHGPPGTGKTHIARGLANLGGCYFYPLKLADIKGEYVGHSGKNVQRIFQEARASAPTLLFIDEIDTIFGTRGGNNQDSFANDVVNQFLAETDGVDTSKQAVFIIGATNRAELVDSAVKSRLEPVKIDLPDEEARSELLRKGLEKNFDTAELEKLVDKSTGLSGRDLKSLTNSIRGIQQSQRCSAQEAGKQALENMRKNIAEDLSSESFRIETADRTTPSKDFLANIIGYDELKEQLNLAVNMVCKDTVPYARLKENRLEPPNGILLYGPPGNGKTYLAESLALHNQMDFVLASGQNLTAGYVDGVIRQLDQIIDNTIRMAAMGPILLFFDEFDALASDGGLSMKFRGALLSSIDRLRKYPNILLVAATNNYQELNEAVIRPGRFDNHLYMGNPGWEEICIFIESFCNQDGFIQDWRQSELEDLARELEHQQANIARIKVLCEEMKRNVVLRGGVAPYHLDYALLQNAALLDSGRQRGRND